MKTTMVTAAMKTTIIATAFLSLLSSPFLASAQQSTAGDAGTLDAETAARAHPTKPGYSPYAGRNFPTRPLFGDTHLHTAMSFDAGMFGCQLGPVDSYRFARGEEVTSSSGQRVRLSRPLDFLVVTDHSDFMGLAPDFLGGKPEVMADPTARRWHDLVHAGKAGQAFNELLPLYGAGKMPATMQYLPGSPGYRSAWQATIQAAEQANQPGRFTAFIGYEWTSNTEGNNLHRNVIFRDDGAKASQIEPYTTFPPLGSDDPRELWKWMAAYEQKTGGRLLAISHNGNLSNGRMFPIIEPVSGGKLDKDYALTRTKWERLYEVTQTKGDSETHPFLSPNDEFADYSRWDRSNLDGSERKKQEMLEFEYARSAYKNGLKLEAELGANPFKFGLVGSTDSHIGISAVEEDNFFGKMATAEPNPQRVGASVHQERAVGRDHHGLGDDSRRLRRGVGAGKHARVHFRRHADGARLTPRPDRAWWCAFSAAGSSKRRTHRIRSPAMIGYSKGVPMGGDLSATHPQARRPRSSSRRCAIPSAPTSTAIQIIKGWLDAKGELHEKVYDVAWGGDREPGADGKAPTGRQHRGCARTPPGATPSARRN